MDPNQIFSPELWELIFGKVEDAQDWLNLFRTSPYFEKLVGHQKPLVLFPTVFSHAFKYVWDGSLPSVLSLRLVSRAWNGAVDQQMESLALRAIEEGGTPSWRKAYELDTPDKMSKFLVKFDAHPPPRNPIIGRSIQLDYILSKEGGRLKDYNRLACQFMDKFGNQLRALDIIDFAHGVSSFDNCAARIKNNIRRAPCLEALKIGIDFLEGNDGTTGAENNVDDGDSSSAGPDDGLPITRCSLKSLAFEKFGSQEGLGAFFVGLQDTVIRMACNPDTLLKISCHGFPKALLNSPNLEEVLMHIHTEEDCSNLLKASSWPLSVLRVRSVVESCGFMKLVQVASTFKETLTNVLIRSPEEGRSPDEKLIEFSLDLPHLKYLGISEMISFDSVLSLRNLEGICFWRNVIRAMMR